ncbi:protein of unknown function (plasmid) [Magnetospirillum sp. XM-1]|nr:protein of unknown function [Magnetospirillum sp. XM-1]
MMRTPYSGTGSKRKRTAPLGI